MSQDNQLQQAVTWERRVPTAISALISMLPSKGMAGAIDALIAVGALSWEPSVGLDKIAAHKTMSPDLVLADEPTGNLDTQSADGVFDLMRQVNRESGTTVLVTHNLDLAKPCDPIVDVIDGRITA